MNNEELEAHIRESREHFSKRISEERLKARRYSAEAREAFDFTMQEGAKSYHFDFLLNTLNNLKSTLQKIETIESLFP